jgi:hypothetical protein
MIRISDILSSNKIMNNHRLFLIACLNIPFFINKKMEDQSYLCGISLRTVHRIKKDLTEMGIIKVHAPKDIEIDYAVLKKML